MSCSEGTKASSSQWFKRTKVNQSHGRESTDTVVHALK